ncbi:MAG: hypothetical protein JWR80_694 [Bradyrhizobium sp.]|nr:hypothetical protein [Bradyrhizobium sp.]
MSVETTMQGKWCLLVEEEPYHPEGRTVLTFRNGLVVDGDGAISPYHINGNTLTTLIGQDVTLSTNPGGPDTKGVAADLAISEERVQAIVTTSFDDGSDDLIEYAILVREAE